MYVCVLKPASDYSPAAEKVYRSGAFHNAAVVRRALRDDQLVTFMKNVFFAVKNFNIFAVHADNVFIEFVHILFGLSVSKICPETHLATVGCFIEISVDVRRILLAVINMI